MYKNLPGHIGLSCHLRSFPDQDALIILARFKTGLPIPKRAAVVSPLLQQLQYKISYAEHSSTPIQTRQISSFTPYVNVSSTFLLSVPFDILARSTT